MKYACIYSIPAHQDLRNEWSMASVGLFEGRKVKKNTRICCVYILEAENQVKKLRAYLLKRASGAHPGGDGGTNTSFIVALELAEYCIGS